MKAFAFRKIEYGHPNPTATAKNDQIDRDPIGTDWFGQRLHAGKTYTPVGEDGFKYYPTRVWIKSKQFKELTPWVIYAAHWGVCETVKQVIEGLEPGKHQFLPVSLTYGTKEKFEEYRYYTLLVNALINDVDVEKSDVTWEETPWGTRMWTAKAAVPAVLPAVSIQGLHLWRNERLSRWMMSGDLKEVLENQGLTAGLAFEEHFVV